MCKKIFSLVCFLLVFRVFVFDSVATQIYPKPATSAQAHILIEASSGLVLCEKNADQILPMASTTKIMTALVAIENGGNLDRIIKVSPLAAGVEGTSIYLYAGENITLRSLLYAVLVQSANDAAAAVAIDIGGSIEGFAQMMNQKASTLGLRNTHFDNPHGLDSKNHYTTARELAKITAAALQNEEFAKMVSTKKVSIPVAGQDTTRYLTNHNRLLFSYKGAIGVKTGFTKKSGRCLVTAALRDEMTVIAVTLNAPNDWADHTRLLDYAFENYRIDSLCTYDKNSIHLPVITGVKNEVLCKPEKELQITSQKDATEITTTIETERFLYAPVKKGEVVGTIFCYQNGELIEKINIVATEDVKVIKYNFNFFDWLSSLFKG